MKKTNANESIKKQLEAASGKKLLAAFYNGVGFKEIATKLNEFIEDPEQGAGNTVRGREVLLVLSYYEDGRYLGLTTAGEFAQVQTYDTRRLLTVF